MHRVTILIATRNRWDKLCATLNSIDVDVDVVVVCDGDKDTYAKLESMPVKRLLSVSHIGSVACRNLALRKYHMDGCLYATDDVIFCPGAIQRVLDLFNVSFPDDDGVVGLRQDQSFHETGVALVGSTFLNRYPERQLFFPKYYHFAAQEIFWYCKELEHKEGRPFFVQDPEVSLAHKHPAFYKELVDQTHREARAFKSRDMTILNCRAAMLKVWPEK